PQPPLFRMALRRLGLAAAEAAMVGDSVESDVAGGRAVGMRTGLYAPGGAPPGGGRVVVRSWGALGRLARGAWPGAVRSYVGVTEQGEASSLGGQADVAQALEEFVAAARAAFGDHLESVVLYGSAAEGTLRAPSDVNVIVVLRAFDGQRAERMREAARLAH